MVHGMLDPIQAVDTDAGLRPLPSPWVFCIAIVDILPMMCFFFFNVMNCISFYHILSAGHNAVRLEHFLHYILFHSQTRIVNEPILAQLAHTDNSLWIEKEQSDQEGANGSIFVT